MSGKKFADATKQFDRDRYYAPTEALGLVKQMATAKFDENVDIAFRLGVDPRKADQMVRGTVALPSGTGKDVRVAAGSATVPRTIWSALRGSTPRRNAMSTFSSNLAVAICLTRPSASVGA